MSERNMRNECYSCMNKRDVPGNCHIKCINPDESMKGSQHGINNGWFIYPILFDPVWKESICNNYESKVHPVSGAISQAISQAAQG